MRYRGNIQTENDIDEIHMEILSLLEYKRIVSIAMKSKLVMLKCKIYKKNLIYKMENKRKEIEQAILELYSNNKGIKDSLYKEWGEQIKSVGLRLNNLDIKSVKRIVDNETNNNKLFEMISILWCESDEEKRALADEIYERYIINKEDRENKEVKIEEKTMDNNILEMSIGEFLSNIKGDDSENQKEIQQLIKANSNEVKKVMQKIKSFSQFNEELKKTIDLTRNETRLLSKEIKEINKSHEESLKEINIGIRDIRKDIEKLKEEKSNDDKFKLIDKNIKLIEKTINDQSDSIEIIKQNQVTIEDIKSLEIIEEKEDLKSEVNIAETKDLETKEEDDVATEEEKDDLKSLLDSLLDQ